MKASLTQSLVVAALALATLSSGVLLYMHARPVGASASGEATSVPAPEPVLEAEVVVNAAGEAIVVTSAIPAFPLLPEREEPEPVAVAVERIAFQPGQVLAKVNGVAVRGHDVAPRVRGHEGEPVSMSAAMYEFRLGQAIDRALTFEAARQAGVELEAEALSKLTSIPKNLIHDEAVVDSLGDQVAEIAHEINQAKAFLLERRLLELAGAPAPHVTAEQVEAYYLENADRLGVLPEEPEARAAAWRSIDVAIRKELAPRAMQSYRSERDAYFSALRAAAQISTFLYVATP